jgi:hypothetical protein
MNTYFRHFGTVYLHTPWNLTTQQTWKCAWIPVLIHNVDWLKDLKPAWTCWCCPGFIDRRKWKFKTQRIYESFFSSIQIDTSFYKKCVIDFICCKNKYIDFPNNSRLCCLLQQDNPLFLMESLKRALTPAITLLLNETKEETCIHLNIFPIRIFTICKNEVHFILRKNLVWTCLLKSAPCCLPATESIATLRLVEIKQAF